MSCGVMFQKYLHLLSTTRKPHRSIVKQGSKGLNLQGMSVYHAAMTRTSARVEGVLSRTISIVLVTSALFVTASFINAKSKLRILHDLARNYLQASSFVAWLGFPSTVATMTGSALEIS